MPTTSRENRLASSTSSCSFPLSEVMSQFPITNLWKDYSSHVVFKVPRVEALCAVPIRLSRCVAGAQWDLQLGMAVGGDGHVFFSRTSLSQSPSAVLCHARRGRCAMGLIVLSVPVEMRLRHMERSSAKASQGLTLMEKYFSEAWCLWYAFSGHLPNVYHGQVLHKEVALGCSFWHPVNVVTVDQLLTRSNLGA